MRACELLVGLVIVMRGEGMHSSCTPASMAEAEDMYYATGYSKLYLLSKVGFGGTLKTRCHTNM